MAKNLIILTGGGSSGHVTPNFALIPELKKRGYQVNYIGSINGIERALVKEEGIPYYGISSGKLRRYFSFKNFTDLFRILLGIFQSYRILKKLKPQLIFSKGGFVTCPVVWMGWLLKIPVIIHESDISTGLANKLAIPFARKVCISFPEAGKGLSKKKKVMTGLPLRDTLLKGNKEKGFAICGFNNSKPVLLVFGGSLGSSVINEAIRNALSNLTKEYQVCHICGKGKINQDYLNITNYKQFEYVTDELPDLFAISEIIISRAGATSINEIRALRKLNLLIPLSTKSSRGDQILNAQSYEKQGLSTLLYEEDLTPERLIKSIDYISKNSSQLKSRLQGYDINIPVKTIVDTIESELRNS